MELVVTTDDEQLRTVGRVVTRPTETDGAGGMLSMSVEVDMSEAARIAAAEDVRLVLLDPGDDPVYDGGAG